MRTLRVAFGVSLGILSLPAVAQDPSPFQALRTYDSQVRKPTDEIVKRIRSAGSDAHKIALIEIELDRVLDDPAATFAGKQEAARFLWEIGTGKSVPSLAKALRNDQLANIARYALERNPDPLAAAALRSALQSSTGERLVGLINSIGNRADSQAVGSLTPLVVSRDKLVSEAAITALGKIGTLPALTVLKLLRDKDLVTYQAILRAAGKLASGGNRAVAELTYSNLLGAGSTAPSVIKGAALQALSATGSRAFELPTLAALQSGDTLLEQIAARICASDSRLAKQGRKLWSRLSYRAQAAFVAALAERNDPNAADVARLTLENQDGTVRMTGVRALGRIGGSAAVPTLADIAAYGPESANARTALAGMSGPGVEEALIRVAMEGKLDRRAMMLGVLAERPSPTVTAALLRAAQESDSRVSAPALKSLGAVGGAEQALELVKLLVSNESAEVRDGSQSAIVAIAQRTSDRTGIVNSLFQSLSSSSGAARSAIVNALAEIGGDVAFSAVTSAALSADGSLRAAGIAALANTWSDVRPITMLLDIAKSERDRGLRIQALRGYLRLAALDDRADAAVRLVRVKEAFDAAERPEEKKQALSALRDVRVPGAIELAVKYLDDSDVRAEAADAILYLAAPQRKGNRNLPAVTGVATEGALDRVIQTVQDENVRAQARKLRGQS